MWTLIDNFEADDRGDLFRTYASQVGPIGCLVLVVGQGQSSVTFVPGVQIQGKKLAGAAGFGEAPKPFEMPADD